MKRTDAVISNGDFLQKKYFLTFNTAMPGHILPLHCNNILVILELDLRKKKQMLLKQKYYKIGKPKYACETALLDLIVKSFQIFLNIK